MKSVGFFVGIVAVALMAVVPAAAQNYPTPTKEGEPLAKVDGMPLYPYSSPFVTHTGRFLDSIYTLDYHGTPRTLRANGMSVAPEYGKVYARLGSHFVTYDLSSFFTSDLGSPLSSRIIQSRKNGVKEQYLPWRAHANPEDIGSGWKTYIWDGQDRLFQYAWDDRGYAYLTYSVWGFGIVDAKSVQLVKQVESGETSISAEVIEVFKANGKYYLLVSDGSRSTEIWDVTQPTAPVRVRSMDEGVLGVAVAEAGNQQVVAVGVAKELRLYRAQNLVQGGAPFLQNNVQFRDIESDGTNFYMLSRDGGSATITTYMLDNSAAPSYRSRSFSYSGYNWKGLRYGSGHLAVTGLDTDKIENAWLFRLEGDTPVQRELGEFIKRYYFQQSDDYYAPKGTAGNTNANEALYVQHGGKEYLAVSFRGFGDVFELEAPDRLNISLDGAVGTHNPNTPSTSSGIFYADPLRFSSIYPSGQVSVNWNFGNPEGIAKFNQQTALSGQSVTYQYAGLKTSEEIDVRRTVTGTDATNSSNSATANVNMQVPTARVRVTGTGAIVPGTDLSSFGVVAGDTFVDASDGKLESHYGEWTIDGQPVAAAAGTAMSVGTCGPQQMSYTAHYVPYEGSGTNVTPLLGENAHFLASLGTVSYEVKPFIPQIEVVSSGSTVEFRNRTRLNSSTFNTGALWTVEWELKNASGATVQTEVDNTTVGTLDKFQVAKSAIDAGYTVTMKVLVDASVLTDVSCATLEYLTAEATHALVPPDPVILQSGCTEAKGPCTLTISSQDGADVSDWTVAWYLDGALVTKGETYSPTLPEAGTYQIRADATNDFGEGSAAISLTVTAPACSEPGLFSIGWTGQSSGCTGSSCTSSSETYQFAAQPWKWNVDSCHTFAWDFGDGSKSNQQTPQHKYSSNGTYTIKVTISNGSGSTTSETATITLGGSTGGDPGGPTCSAPPSGSVFPGFTGRTSGCTSGAPDCEQGETIDFKGDTWRYTVQTGCDSFEWSFGDGRSSSARNPSISYSNTGTYTVRFTIRNSGGSASGQTTVKISPKDDGCSTEPVVLDINYMGTESGCSATGSTGCLPAEEIRFSPATWQYNWQDCDTFLWDFGDGTTSTTREPRHTYSAGGEHTVKLKVSNRHGSSEVSRTVLIGTPATPPSNVSFTYSPERPKPGEDVTFTAKQGGGDPATSWSWNFGDGSMGSGEVVTHAFATEGEFAVSLVASNSGGDGNNLAVRSVKVSETLSYLLPVATHAGGWNGTEWRTDLHIFQPEYDGIANEVEFQFQGKVKKRFLDKSTDIIEDFLSEIFAADGTAGPVFVRSAAPIEMWTRTYVVSASGVGTYGQLIPAALLNSSGGLEVGTASKSSIIGLDNGERFRTNLGFVNPTGQRAELKVEIIKDDGFLLKEGSGANPFTVFVEPYTWSQEPMSVWYPGLPSDQRFSLRIQNQNGVEVFSYASVIDNISNDPAFVGAVSDSVAADPAARKVVVPGVGHLVVPSGTWKSDVAIFHPGSKPVTMNLDYYDDAGANLATTFNVQIYPQETLYLDDVLRSEVIQVESDSLGTLHITTNESADIYPIAVDRTYNDQGPLGTFGQGISSVPLTAGNVKLDSPAFLTGIRNDPSYYTNLGLVSLSDEPTVVRIVELRANEGGEGNARTHTLQAKQSVIINRILPFLNSEASRATLRIEVLSGGPVWAYGSVVDDLTKDPEYVPAVPVAPVQ